MMKPKKAHIVKALMIMIAIVLLAGCSKPKNLEEYIQSHSQLKEEIEDIAIQNSDKLGQSVINTKENTLYFTYTFIDTFGEEEAKILKNKFKEMRPEFKTSFTSFASQLSEESEIEGVQISVIYKNGDGSELFNQTYQAQ